MRLQRDPDTGKRWYASKRGWFYLGWGGDIFVFCLSLGRLTVTWEAR